ncbi:hypothetical protein ASD11_05525 [Aeromicrobium sp. Root495]|uniref:hypothetical protein n=1 Tax=Aeromicrobium sp. Root495 TaxID=1736550 RepID=UPI0006F9F65C|nr:hypothetical protein [Aeromicrobium sp. Root495]KQY59066.1 hypothetical protein ASD11_05525 [Aeromicrobium sp. Root495]
MTTNQPPPYPGDQPDDSSSTSGLPSYGSTPPPPPPPPGADYPPPPPQPPGGPGGFQQPFSAPDAIAWGWKAFTANVGPILLAALVVILVNVAFSAAGFVIGGGFDAETAQSFSLANVLLNLLSTIVVLFLSAAFARAALDVVDGRGFDFFGAFGRINLVSVVVASIAVSILTVIGFVLLIIPGLIVLFLTYFTTNFVVDDDAGSPFKAIGDSVKLVSSNLGDALLLALLSFLVIVVGFCALIIGVIVAYPVVALSSAYAYRRFRGQPVAAL